MHSSDLHEDWHRGNRQVAPAEVVDSVPEGAIVNLLQADAFVLFHEFIRHANNKFNDVLLTS